MTFRVDIPALRGLPTFLDRRDSDLHAALAYLRTYAVIRDISPLYRAMYHRHEANVATIGRFLIDAATYVSTDAIRVRTAANAYTLADAHARIRTVAAADDALDDFPTGLPDPPPTFAPDAGSDVFADRTIPSGLYPPSDPAAGAVSTRPPWASAVDAAGAIREAIWVATRLAVLFGWLDRAYDPIDLLLTPFVGDWPGLLRSAETLTTIAGVLNDESTAIAAAHRVVPTVWAGHASDACQCSLNLLGLAFRTASSEVAALGSAYRDAGVLLQSLMTTANHAFDAVVDAAADVVAAQLGAGTLLSYTMPGTVAAFGATVTSFRELARDVGRIVDRTFPPGDPLGSLASSDRPLVLPNMAALAAEATIPSLAAAPAALVALRADRAAA